MAALISIPQNTNDLQPALEVEVLVKLHDTEPDDDAPRWMMIINVKMPIVDCEYTCTLIEPYSIPQSQWDCLISGISDVYFYTGNGDGYIKCKDGKYIFVVTAEGGYGDVSTRFSVPIKCLSSLIKAAIDKVKQVGYKFIN